MMTRTLFKGAFILVEGVTDDRVYGKFVSEEARIIQCHSKESVRKAVKELTGRRKVSQVIGIVDADLDVLDGKHVAPPMFYTDCRDMEMMCICSNALEDIVNEYGDRSKVARFKERYGSIKEAVLNASVPLGLLMHVSKRQGLGLNFGDLDFSVFVNPHTLAVDYNAMIDAVVMNSRRTSVSKRSLLRSLREEMEALEDPWVAGRGHDAVEILLLGLKKGFGSFNARYLTNGALGGSLRLAFSDSDFRATRLYKDTEAWGEANGLRLWDLRRSLEIRFGYSAGGLDYLLDPPLAVVQDRLAVVPENDRLLVYLQALVQVRPAGLEPLDQPLQLRHALLERQRRDFLLVFLALFRVHFLSSLLSTLALTAPSLMRTDIRAPTGISETDATTFPPSSVMRP